LQPPFDLRTKDSTKFRARGTGAGERNRELDGLRGIAISLVLISHFWDQEVPIMDGHAGVRLFFVLSGFLITNILLQCRGEADRGAATAGTLLLAFYARRCLRIFPTYYLLLAAIRIFDVDQIHATIWWHAAYASNILAAVRGGFDRVTAHYWTLSIEEQFYLFWPFVILFLPRSKLSIVAIALVAIGILSRPVALCLNINSVALYTNPFASLDAFGLGALLAIMRFKPLPS
jgi:peptidoglycan/LPS O-acetylase OafA/YrhL